METELKKWFEVKLDESDCASVKRFYLERSVFNINKCDDFTSMMCICRILAADQRVLWEHLSDSFLESFTSPVDLWNEQLAVKLLRSWIEQLTDKITASQLYETLENHLNKTVKPVTSLPLVKPHDNDTRESSKLPYLVIPASTGVEGSLVCNTPLPAFADLLRVPRSSMFFIDTVVEFSELGRVVHASTELSDIFTDDEPLLVLALIYERYVAKDASHWRELISSCPTMYPTVPSFWDWDDLAELEGLDVLDDVLAKRAQLLQFHTEVMSVLPIIYEALEGRSGLEKDDFLDQFSVEAIMWARATFDSRAFNLRVDERVVLSLVPIADMINHNNRSNVLVRKVEPNKGDFVMQIGPSLTAEDVGHELWMSYGPLQNWELLQFYGFVLENNEYDKLPFPFDTPTTVTGDVWDERRASLVAKYALHLVGRCWIGYSGHPPAALLALLRVHLAEAEEFDIMEREGPFVSLSTSTELRVIQTIAETVQCILDLSSTSLEEDMERLKADSTEGTERKDNEDEDEDGDGEILSVNKKLSTILRMGLKRIAYRSLEWCSSAMLSLSA
ncbi:SET domain containing protein [Trypanosoma theileri]|uniref:SET domain containing protein n=1 Tax=Trypanosoma theileri TaxID=67003 RepID=A0A1X0P2C3_9TRYP|nr:SET domain containing protein [Trypanosoma theileri]ORC91077.1 SET domain containing protein [Trypanosoma theileri]